ncbi:MAG: hypothetical protein ACRBCI_10955 [Cellvibrionaceae bacterium]
MMRSLITTACIIAGALNLAGCNNSGSSNNDTATPPPSATERAFTATANDEAVTFDPDILQADLINLFGSENGEPIAINDGDDVSDIFDRVQ